MTRDHRIATGLFCLLSNFAAVLTVQAGADPDTDPHFVKMIVEIQQRIEQGKLEAAVAECDNVISAFKAHYKNERRKIYCGNTPAEVLGTLVGAAVGKQNAIVLSPTWANAYFLKAYALQDLKQLGEAKKTLLSAVELSPTNSHYLNELGEIYQLEKNWSKARETYISAEDNAPLSPDETRVSDLARARRGLGYVYVELGRLDQAEKKYRECLAADPDDHRAAAELQYVKQLKEKREDKAR